MLRLLACGPSNREIAERLVLTRAPRAGTPKTSTRRFDERDRAQVSLFAVKHGLLRAQPTTGS
jgi:DNA-binding NarL/FixJ family response regulator